jgi:TP901 family phage tail tape measure protein
MASILLGNLVVTLGIDASQLYKTKLLMAQSMQGMVDKANKSADNIEKSGRKMMNFYSYGYRATMMLTVPLTMLGKAVATTFAAYESSMTKIIALTGASADSVKGWSEELLNMAPIVTRGPKELAEAMYFVSSSGFKGAEALQIVQQSAMGAAAGLGDTKDIANLVTSAMNAYRKSGLDASTAMDVLVAAVREGKGEATDFARTIGSVIPMAAELGVSFDQVAGAMAAMTLTGASAANSATYLRGILNQLLDPSRGVDEAMENIGTSAQELRDILRQKGLMAALTRIRDLSREWGQDVIGEIFPNIRALIGVLSLMGENLEYNEEVMKRVKNSTGDATEAFQKGANTLERKWNRALALVQSSAIQFGDTLKSVVVPALNWVSQALKDTAQWFDNLSPTLKKLTLKFAGLLAVSGPLWLVFGFLKANIIPALIRAFIWLLTPITNLTITVKGLWMSFKALGIAMAANAWNPIVLVLMAMGAAFWSMSKSVKAVVNELFPLKEVLVLINEEMVNLLDIKPTDFSNFTADTAYEVWDKAKRSLENYQIEYNKLLDTIISVENTPAKTYGGALGNVITGNMVKQTLLSDLKTRAKEMEKVMYDLQLVIYDTVVRTHGITQELTEVQKRNEESAIAAADAYKKITIDPRVVIMSKELARELGIIDAKSKTLLGTYDASSERISTLTKYIEDLTEKMKKQQSNKFINYIKGALTTIEGWVKQLNDARLDQFNRQLDLVGIKGELLGNLFNEHTEKAKLLQDRIDLLTGDLQLLEKTFGKNSFVAFALRMQIVGLTGDMKEETAASKALDALRQHDTLEKQARKYNTLAAQIELVNFDLETAKNVLKEYLKNPTGTTSLDTLLENINKLERKQITLPDVENLQYLSDMYNVTGKAATGTEILSARLSAIQDQMKWLSAHNKGKSEEFLGLAKQMVLIEDVQSALDILGSAFQDFYSSIIEGGKNMSDVLKGIMRNMITRIIEMLVQKLMMSVALKILQAVMGGGPAMVTTPKLTGLPGFKMNMPGLRAKGGIVPPGYPNDTYPSMLTSGETIIPLSKLNNMFKRKDNWDGKVVFHIGQDELTGILRKATKKNSIY